MKRLDLATNAGARDAALLAGRQALKPKHPLVGNVSGQGLTCAVELVADHTAKGAAAKDLVHKVQDGAYADGVMMILWSGGL